MSYTSFEYSDLKVNKANFTSEDLLEFEVKVTNTGKMAGKESVLLYSSDLFASLVPDSRRLRAFEKIELRPGESQVVKMAVPATDLAFVNSGDMGEDIVHRGGVLTGEEGEGSS